MITLKRRPATAQPHLTRMLSITARDWGMIATARSWTMTFRKFKASSFVIARPQAVAIHAVNELPRRYAPRNDEAGSTQ